MIAWLLIVQVFAGGPSVPAQLGPFQSEAACEAAWKAMERTVVSARHVCVPTGEIASATR